MEDAWADSMLEWCKREFGGCASPVRNMQTAWLAGLIEGEGSFILSKGSAEIAVQMTDRDVIAKAAEIIGRQARAPWRRKDKPHHKPVYSCRVHGAHAVVWMLTLYPFMGERRKDKIKSIVERLQTDFRPKAPRGTRWPAVCHKDQKRVGFGLCSRCYMRRWRKQRSENPSAAVATAQPTVGP